MAYIDAHPEMTGPALGGKFLANINMDMVGENTELLHSKLVLTRTPLSIPSVLNDVVENMARMVDGLDIRTPRGSQSIFNYRIIPYSGGSDHMMFIDRKIPAMMFSHDPDYTHHTSEDTPDKVDPVELERCEIIAAGSLWYLANLDSLQGVDAAYLARANARGRLGDAARQVQRSLARADKGALPDMWAYAANVITQKTQQEIDMLQSIPHFNGSNYVGKVIDALKEQVHRDGKDLLNELHIAMGGLQSEPRRPVESGAPAPEQNPDVRVPVRLTRGPLDFDLPTSRLRGPDSLWYSSPDFVLSYDERFELVNFIDGQRTVSDIRLALSAEFRPIEARIVARYITDLVRAGAVRLK
jgi:hypothetical protein